MRFQLGDDGLLAVASAAAKSLDVRSEPKVRLVNGLRSPVVTGLLTPTIWLPDESSTWSPSKLRSVCLHELAHRRRSDGAWQWFGWLTASAWWWN
ncbi:MAG TPA: M56 family metallopeptidase, partial [Flavobacteriales bacterium]|nr:M56 family metallopeptidase [Flavobacteriales bacterium]